MSRIEIRPSTEERGILQLVETALEENVQGRQRLRTAAEKMVEALKGRQ